MVAAEKGAWPGGIGEVVRSRAFLFFIYFFSSFNVPTVYHEKRGLTLIAPKRVLVVSSFLAGHFFRGGNSPPLPPKTHFLSADNG